MKTIKQYLLLLSLGCLTWSCSDFLDREPTTAIDDDKALLSAAEVSNAARGLHATIRHPGYYGKNFLVIGDVTADVLTKKYALSDNRFSNMEMYTITDNQSELLELWAIMYRCCDRAARIIESSKTLLPELNTSDTRTVRAHIAQAYAIKGLTLFNLVNLFGLPYTGTAQDAQNPGVILVKDQRIRPTQAVERASVKDVYAQVLNDLDSAKAYFVGASTMVYTQMNLPTALGVEARVRLFMKDYAGADTVARLAIEKRRGTMARNPESLVAMHEGLTASTEDMFVLTTNKAEDFGTESINNLFRSYGTRLSPIVTELYESDDWRNNLLILVRNDEYNTLKYTSSTALNKMPVMRLAEMYLIRAEAANELGRISDAQTALLTVASRNPAIASTSDLPSDAEGLRIFIEKERMRELAAEGFRWMDLRRKGQTLTRPENTSLRTLNQYKVYLFCFPIPQSEINASGIQQNGWSQFLPQ